MLTESMAGLNFWSGPVTIPYIKQHISVLVVAITIVVVVVVVCCLHDECLLVQLERERRYTELSLNGHPPRTLHLAPQFAPLFTFAIEMEETQRDESVQQWNTTALEVFYPFCWEKYFLRFFAWFSLTRDPGDGVVMC